MSSNSTSIYIIDVAKANNVDSMDIEEFLIDCNLPDKFEDYYPTERVEDGQPGSSTSKDVLPLESTPIATSTQVSDLTASLISNRNQPLSSASSQEPEVATANILGIDADSHSAADIDSSLDVTDLFQLLDPNTPHNIDSTTAITPSFDATDLLNSDIEAPFISSLDNPDDFEIPYPPYDLGLDLSTFDNELPLPQNPVSISPSLHVAGSTDQPQQTEIPPSSSAFQEPPKTAAVTSNSEDPYSKNASDADANTWLYDAIMNYFDHWLSPQETPASIRAAAELYLLMGKAVDVVPENSVRSVDTWNNDQTANTYIDAGCINDNDFNNDYVPYNAAHLNSVASGTHDMVASNAQITPTAPVADQPSNTLSYKAPQFIRVDHAGTQNWHTPTPHASLTSRFPESNCQWNSHAPYKAADVVSEDFVLSVDTANDENQITRTYVDDNGFEVDWDSQSPTKQNNIPYNASHWNTASSGTQNMAASGSHPTISAAVNQHFNASHYETPQLMNAVDHNHNWHISPPTTGKPFNASYYEAPQSTAANHTHNWHTPTSHTNIPKRHYPDAGSVNFEQNWESQIPYNMPRSTGANEMSGIASSNLQATPTTIVGNSSVMHYEAPQFGGVSNAHRWPVRASTQASFRSTTRPNAGSIDGFGGNQASQNPYGQNTVPNSMSHFNSTNAEQNLVPSSSQLQSQSRPTPMASQPGSFNAAYPHILQPANGHQPSGHNWQMPISHANPVPAYPTPPQTNNRFVTPGYLPGPSLKRKIEALEQVMPEPSTKRMRQSHSVGESVANQGIPSLYQQGPTFRAGPSLEVQPVPGPSTHPPGWHVIPSQADSAYFAAPTNFYAAPPQNVPFTIPPGNPSEGAKQPIYVTPRPPVEGVPGLFE